MARIELPESRLKARRKHRRIGLAVFLVLAVLVVIGGLAALSHVPFLKITTISVSGTQTISSSTLQSFVESRFAGNYFYVFSKSNILLYPRGTISAALPGMFPAIKGVDVHADDFHTVAVTIVEREPKALWCTGPLEQAQNCFVMDEDGLLYAPAAVGEGLVVYHCARGSQTLPAQFITPAQFRALSALVDALSQTETPGVAQVSIDGAGDAEAVFGNNFILKFALADAGGDVFERFVLALQSDPFKNHPLSDFAYLDLRFGDKLYYKLK